MSRDFNPKENKKSHLNHISVQTGEHFLEVDQRLVHVQMFHLRLLVWRCLDMHVHELGHFGGGGGKNL